MQGKISNRTRSPAGLEAFREHSSLLSWGVWGFFYLAILISLAGKLPREVLTPGSDAFILVIGVIGIWRYSWAALHLLRAWIFLHLVFPRIRRRADRMTSKPSHLFVVVTSYRMATEVNAQVYRRLFEEIARYGVPATIYACVTDPADGELLSRLFDRQATPEGSNLVLMSQAGKGKRDAMAKALWHMQAQAPAETCQLVLMDGDTLLGTGCLHKACSILQSEADIGAVTTENIPLVRGSTLQREWYRIRMLQRNNLMSSLSLSRKTLVLTGRFSVFKGAVACSPSFPLAIEQDRVEHWRIGRIELLTGDDKSTWFNVISRGWNMLYVPDSIVHPIEELPRGGFVLASVNLMTRWFGNMVRSNGRALRLGPHRCGPFLWVCLLDQRISMWTTLLGPTFASLATMLHSSVYFTIYAFWVMATRGLYCLFLYLTGGRLHPLFPFLLYYTQIVGALVKVYVTFHPYRQRWTRQNIARDETSLHDATNAFLSGIYNVVMAALFVVLVAVLYDVSQLDERGIQRSELWVDPGASDLYSR